ncbi:hypothetical protein MMC12_006535 [Toensbergia leucococca]|nr:hypothetical protein [Toensbergia leucococca]
MSRRFDMGGLDGFEFAKQYSQFSVAPPSRSAYSKEHDKQLASNHIAPLAHYGNACGTNAAPVLPPIRIPEQSLDNYRQLRPRNTPSAPQLKEEKAAGGVAAHLDYEMDQMADFVSEMAQGMYDLYESRICLADIDIIRSVHPNSSVPIAFRKYVLQVLSSTRLPSSTILLGLYYLATRMIMLSTSGRYTAGSGQVYRMLTTSLLLGSKFLDDNTFQNRSWSEVSNIPISELNVLEIEWLLAINWDMHIDFDDKQGFVLWHKHWERWQAKKVETSMDSLKLTPLDANVQRQRSMRKSFSPTPLYQTSCIDLTFGVGAKESLPLQWSTPRFDSWPPIRRITENSPSSAPDTGPNTPDWFGRIDGLGYGHAPPPTFSARTIPPPAQISQHLRQKTVYNTTYPHQYSPSSWNGHGDSCGCGYCVPHHDRYFMAPGFGPQSVAG